MNDYSVIMVCPSIHGRVFCVFHRFVPRGLIIRLCLLLDLFFHHLEFLYTLLLGYRIIFCKNRSEEEEEPAENTVHARLFALLRRLQTSK